MAHDLGVAHSLLQRWQEQLASIRLRPGPEVVRRAASADRLASEPDPLIRRRRCSRDGERALGQGSNDAHQQKRQLGRKPSR